MTVNLNKEDYERYLVELKRKQRKVEQLMRTPRDVFSPTVHIDNDLLEEIVFENQNEVDRQSTPFTSP